MKIYVKSSSVATLDRTDYVRDDTVASWIDEYVRKFHKADDPDCNIRELKNYFKSEYGIDLSYDEIYYGWDYYDSFIR